MHSGTSIGFGVHRSRDVPGRCAASADHARKDSRRTPGWFDAHARRSCQEILRLIGEPVKPAVRIRTRTAGGVHHAEPQ